MTAEKMSGKHEYESVAVRRPFLIAGGVVGFVVFAAAAMVALYLLFSAATPEQPFRVTTFAQPRLQITPEADLRRVDESQREKLERTEWRDRDAGVLAIPIEAAMAAIAARGENAYAPLPGAASLSAGNRPAGAEAPDDRRPNPGSGVADPLQEGR